MFIDFQTTSETSANSVDQSFGRSAWDVLTVSFSKSRLPKLDDLASVIHVIGFFSTNILMFSPPDRIVGFRCHHILQKISP